MVSSREPLAAPPSSRRGLPAAAAIAAAGEPPPPSSRRGRRTASAFVAALTRELAYCVPERSALALVSACAASAGVPPESLGPVHLPAVLAQVRRSFRSLGVPDDRRDACLSRLLTLCWPLQDAVAGGALHIEIERESDIVRARQAGREICEKLGFSEIGAVKVATAISELARNIVKYAGRGDMTLRALEGPRTGIEIVASDHGPGIPDLAAALRPGFRSRTGMGAGLRGTRALMDSFDVVTARDQGTVVTVRKGRS